MSNDRRCLWRWWIEIGLLLVLALLTWDASAAAPGVTTPAGADVDNTARDIAIAVQGGASGFRSWKFLLDRIRHKDRVHLFLLSYDVPISEDVCGSSSINSENSADVTCVFAPHTTWTSGRNALGRAVALHEQQRRQQRQREEDSLLQRQQLLNSTEDGGPVAARFKYWLFADQDMSSVEGCHLSTHCHQTLPAWSLELTACCFDIALGILLGPHMHFAAVNFVMAYQSGARGPRLGLLHHDCADAALSAFHKDAVPVVLPYVELVDRFTWWESQGIHFHVVSSCMPGYSVYSNVFYLTKTSGHVNYPRGRQREKAAQAILQVYGGSKGLVPDPIGHHTLQIEQGNCASIPDALSDRWTSHEWQRRTSFMRCLAALQPRWEAFVRTGNLTAIDGAPY